MQQILPREQIKKFSKCLKRELSFRKRVYPKFTANGKMTIEQMDKEIETVEEMINYFDKLDMLTPPEQTKLF